MPGDDLRHVDWQVWARQDRLYVKHFEEDANMRVNLLIDVSNSMNYGNGPLNKHEYASTIAATLALLILKQQDAVGCLTFDESVRSKLPTVSRRDQLNAIIENLNTTQPTNKTSLYKIMLEAAETYPRRGLMIIISDLFGDVPATLKGLRLLRQQGHDVLVFHLMDDDELDFPFKRTNPFCRHGIGLTLKLQSKGATRRVSGSNSGIPRRDSSWLRQKRNRLRFDTHF